MSMNNKFISWEYDDEIVYLDSEISYVRTKLIAELNKIQCGYQRQEAAIYSQGM